MQSVRLVCRGADQKNGNKFLVIFVGPVCP